MTSISEIAEMFGLKMPAKSMTESREALAEKMTMMRRLWAGDDRDAQTAREVINVIEMSFLQVLNDEPLSQLTATAMKPLIDGAMETSDRLVDIGVVRAVASGRPIPGTPAWEAETVTAQSASRVSSY